MDHWNKAERPSVYIESGHVAAMTLAVIDVEKELDKGNDGHGSKVIVIPFDGGALDRDLQSTSESPSRSPQRTSSPYGQLLTQGWMGVVDRVQGPPFSTALR